MFEDKLQDWVQQNIFEKAYPCSRTDRNYKYFRTVLIVFHKTEKIECSRLIVNLKDLKKSKRENTYIDEDYLISLWGKKFGKNMRIVQHTGLGTFSWIALHITSNKYYWDIKNKLAAKEWIPKNSIVINSLSKIEDEII